MPPRGPGSQHRADLGRSTAYARRCRHQPI